MSLAAPDRKSTRLNSKSRRDLVCRLLLEKKKSDDDVAGRVGEEHEETAARRVVGCEREAEQTVLTARDGGEVDVEKVGGENSPAFDDAYAPVLLNDVLHRRIRRVLNECERRRESGRVHARPHGGVRVEGDATSERNERHGHDVNGV